ncbi:hypothetical protein [Modestobacter sp. SSW1-42]|uniref:hypothetical protein n=1 Tax=Modestobacter sp. SSW1-42 TaxID=596372 RepID=UPI00398796A3
MRSAVPDAPRLPAAAAPQATPRAARPARPRRAPVPVVAAGVVSVVESLALLAFGLTGLGSLFAGGARLSGPAMAGVLLVLAGWVVLSAGAGAVLVDGAGRRLLVAVALAEVGVCLAVAVSGLFGPDGVRVVAVAPEVGLPVPALALLALVVPTGKLLLASAPSALAWVAAGGRPRVARRPPVAPQHRVLCGVTLACIGLALAGVAVLATPAEGPAPTTAAVTGAP